MEREFPVLLCFGLMLLFYLTYQGIKRRAGEGTRAVVFKTLATACAAGLATYSAVRHGDAAHILLATGIWLCAAADAMISFHFLPGMCMFAQAHILFGVSFVLLSPPGISSLLVFAVLTLGAILMYPKLKQAAGNGSAWPYFAYALLLFAMLALAVPQRLLLLLGAVWFVISDLMLAYRMAEPHQSTAYDYVCLGAYYLAQFLIAASTVL